jgi:hypothetical protein
MTNQWPRKRAAAAALAFAATFAPWEESSADAEEPAPEMEAEATAATPAPVTAAPGDVPPGDVPPGYYRDGQGRVMQVSFDFGRRLWLGVGYAPRLHASGTSEPAPAAFDFGAAFDALSANGRTRHRLHVLDGQVRLHGFGLDVTGLRYDISHHYELPLLRITTFVGAPERHDLYLNVGLFTELLHFESTPRGIDGEQALTLGTVQATLDLWQSADLRSYVRVRTGPGVEVRMGPWGQATRFVGFFPQAVLEGNLLLGQRAMQLLAFRVRGSLLRTVDIVPASIPGGYLVDAEAAYEAILLAINDQPVAFRIAAQGGRRGDARSSGSPAVSSFVTPGWEWKSTVGFRMSFLSPPVVRR